MLLFAAMLFYLASTSGSALPQVSAPEEPSIALRISLPKDTCRAGDVLKLRVEIENMGHEPVFVGSQIWNVADWIQSLQLVVTDEGGKPYSVKTGLPPFVMPSKDTFTEALVKNWVPLQPGHFYGSTLTLEQPFQKRPGRYKIHALLKCMGMYAPLYYNTLAQHPEEIRKLPYSAWEGIVESNTLSFQVKP
jgi:hypothetical protein